MIIMGLCAMGIGMAKTGLGGLGMVVVPVMANIFGAKSSTGILLLLLIMADFFGVPLQTFMDNFRDIIVKNRLITKQRLRSKQLEVALNGDRTMLIWLGKQMLGQSESPLTNEDNQVLPWLEPDSDK